MDMGVPVKTANTFAVKTYGGYTEFMSAINNEQQKTSLHRSLSDSEQGLHLVCYKDMNGKRSPLPTVTNKRVFADETRSDNVDQNVCKDLLECQKTMLQILNKMDMACHTELLEKTNKVKCSVNAKVYIDDILNAIEGIENEIAVKRDDANMKEDFKPLHENLKLHDSYLNKVKYKEKTMPLEDLGELLRLRLFPYSTIESFPFSESMTNELWRIASLSKFPRNIDISLIRLARAGFYHTGQERETRCYSCGVTYSEWRSGDNPIVVHRRISPDCDLVRQNESENSIVRPDSNVNNSPTHTTTSSIHTEASNLLQTQHTQSRSDTASTHLSSQNGKNDQNASNAYQYDLNGTSLAGLSDHRNEITPDDGTHSISISESYDHSAEQTNGNTRPSNNHETTNNSENEHISTLNPCQNNTNFSSLGINVEKPRYPNYASLPVRISSFQGWPSYLDQTPREMAMAGFLFAGYNDYTRCFFCGGGLRNWEAGDDPWVEHARWFPQCAFLKQNKGEKFINAVIKRQQEIEDEKTEINQSAPQQTVAPNRHVKTPVQNGSNQSNQDHLHSVAVRSVLEMGYTTDQVLGALQKVNHSKEGADKISAEDILRVLLNDDDSDHYTPTTSAEAASNVTSRNDETATRNLNHSPLDDTESLIEENRQLRDQRLCKVCLDLDATIAFLPCGHIVCCTDCAPAMRKCPVCRTYVKGTVKTYLA